MDEGLLVRIVVVEGGLLAATLLALIGHAASVAARLRRRAPGLASAAVALRGALAGGPPDRSGMAALARLPTSAQVGLFAELGASVSGAQKQRLAGLAAEVGLLEMAERWCASRHWWRRLRGARLLTLLGGGQTVVPALLDDPRPEVRAQAAQWAAEHPEPESIDRLLSMLTDSQAVCRFTVKDSLLRVDRAAAEPLLRYLSAISDAPPPEALEVAAGIADVRFLGLALEWCRAPDARTRALAGTLVGSIGGSEATEALNRLLDDADDAVRAAGATGLGKLAHWPAAGPLAERLADPSWEVRKAAALALRGLGAPGALLLRRALSSPDRFAADMARQVLDLPDRRGHPLARELAVA